MREIQVTRETVVGHRDEIVLAMYNMLDETKSGKFKSIDVNLIQRVIKDGRINGEDVGRTFEELVAVKGLIAGVKAAEMLTLNEEMFTSVQTVLSTIPFINLDKASNGDIFKTELETLVQDFREYVPFGKEDVTRGEIAQGIINVCFMNDNLCSDADTITYLALLPIMILDGAVVLPDNINDVLGWYNV